MSMTDPIGDLLTRIRNGQLAKHAKVEIPASRIKLEIVKILESEGFVLSHEVFEDSGFENIRVELKYDNRGRKAITGLERVSRPSRRVFRGKDEIPSVLNGLGVSIVSTSKGVMTGKQCLDQGVGGEVICNVW